MTPAEIENIVQRVVSEGTHFPWWVYLWILLAPLAGGFFGAYLKKKAENLATKEDYESLLTQVKKTTEETESIKTELAKGSWLHQQGWLLKEKYYSGLLESLYNLKRSLSARLDHYMEPGAEYRDSEINESEHFKKQSQIGMAALNKIQLLHGPAEMVISKRAIEALDNFYSVDWNAGNFSSCNIEYLNEVYASAEEAYKVILEEARLELRR
jgi:hypothetical protein